MPGHDRAAGERIEADWYRRGFEDGSAGRKPDGPDSWSASSAAGMGLNTAGAYNRGYDAGRKQYLKEQKV